MTSDDFGAITYGDDRRSERIVRAAVSAFCSLTRPSRREIAQLDDLVSPLYRTLSADTLRYLSAALSECEAAPPKLVARLAGEPITIAAPLLSRSKALTGQDLLTLAGRFGGAHALAILSRPALGQRLKRLIATAASSRNSDPGLPTNPAPSSSQDGPSPSMETLNANVIRTPLAVAGENAENARRKLRAMMEPSATMIAPADLPAPSLKPFDWSADYEGLRDAALSGEPALFQTALADALGLDFERARRLFGGPGYFDLAAGLRSLALSGEQAFLIVAAMRPGEFSHAQSVRIFIERYEMVHLDAARARVRIWRMDGRSGSGRAGAPAANDRLTISRADTTPVKWTAR